ncbi:putative PEP-binding protein [Kaistia granuli]|uniref:putative PEP-binding protein n=1 Tax=Kaistia granuli TaxID=363259 RepID=UPI0003A76B63|nr:putative PEP-binding protein [Kaistia granuli]
MAERLLVGVAASPGLVSGRLWRPESEAASQADPAASTGDDEAALHGAIASAGQALAALLGELDGDEAEVVGMQIAFLEDDELARPAFEAIAAGQPAGAAWAAAMDAEIAAYQASDDEYFRARAVDFQDIRDRVLAELSGGASGPLVVPDHAILLAAELRPSEFLSARWGAGAGLALAQGSPTSHVAMLARGRGLAMVVGLGPEVLDLHGEALLDGAEGTLVVAPEQGRLAAAGARIASEEAGRAQAAVYAARPALSRDGVRVAVQATIADPSDLDGLDPAHFDGIGLVRTELFLDRPERLTDEEGQLAAYARILAWAGGRPVTVRTLDAGGDKPIAGYTPAHEANPFLGMRGIRLSLRHPDVFRVQLRALARAAATGPLKVMLPMVTLPRELADARALLEAEIAALAAAGVAHGRPALGIMVEVPAVAITPERFDAEFFSIGSNDLVQYTCAVSREEAASAELGSVADPSVLALIARVAAHGRQVGREVSLCGDAGGDPALVPALLTAGLRSLSVQPGLAGAVKAVIAGLDLASTDEPSTPPS